MRNPSSLDTKQKMLFNNLMTLKEKLEEKPSFFQRHFSLSNINKHEKMGVYIYGKVGRGKTTLMNMFYEKLAIREKLKIHFHKFMAEIHQEVFNYKSHSLTKDAISEVSKNFSAKYKVICLDELTIDNIADAMIVGRLFENLFNNGTHIVVTSNFHPDDLYKDGLQRENFFKFIRLIIGKLELKDLDTAKDYRREFLADKKIFLSPANEANNQILSGMFEHLIQCKEIKEFSISEDNKETIFEKTAGNIIFTNFSQICERYLWTGDYLTLAENFKIFFIQNIPVFGNNNINEAKRFVALIDILYDNKIMLFASLADKLENLFEDKESFARTESRMIEMQSKNYYNKLY